MLRQALLACTGVTPASVATALGIGIRSARLHAQGQFDARGTLVISRDIPVGAHGIQLTVDLDADGDDEVIARLAAMTQRYRVVGQSLAEPPHLTIRGTATAG